MNKKKCSSIEFTEFANLNDNETKRDENRGVIPPFAEPDEIEWLLCENNRSGNQIAIVDVAPLHFKSKMSTQKNMNPNSSQSLTNLSPLL